MAGKGAVAARERARLAKVKRYANQAKREQRVEDTVTEFYLAADAHEAALVAMATARAAMAVQVEALLTNLKEPVSGVAVLCDITAAQVRALRKEATTVRAETTPAVTETATDTETDPVETSTPNETEPASSVSSTGTDTGGPDDRDGDTDERDGDGPGEAAEQQRAS